MATTVAEAAVKLVLDSKAFRAELASIGVQLDAMSRRASAGGGGGGGRGGSVFGLDRDVAMFKLAQKEAAILEKQMAKAAATQAKSAAAAERAAVARGKRIGAATNRDLSLQAKRLSEQAALSKKLQEDLAKMNKIANEAGGIGANDNGIKRIGDSAKMTTKHINDMKSALDRVAKAVAVSGLGVLGLGAGIAAFAGKASADLEMVTVGFEGLLQTSSEAAQQYTRDLVDFAARTPFEIDEVTKATQRLLGAGFEQASIQPMLTDIGDFGSLLGVSGAEINGFVRALAQIEGKGKFTADNVRQLTENIPGLDAMGLIAEQLGISSAQAFAQMEDGSLSADVGIKALLAGMREFPGASGAMERASLTLTGRVSNLKDSFKLVAFETAESSGFLDALKESVTGLGDSFKGGVAGDGLTAALSSIAVLVKEIGPRLPELIGNLLQGVGKFFESATPGIIKFFDAISMNAESGLGGLGSAFGGLVSVVGSLVEAMTPLLALLDSLPDGFSEIVASIGLLVKLTPNSVFKSIGQGLDSTAKKLTAVQKAAIAAAGAVASFTGGNQLGRGDVAGGAVSSLAGIGSLAMAGSSLGPYGAAAGALAGVGITAFGAIQGAVAKSNEEVKAHIASVDALSRELRQMTSGSPFEIDIALKNAYTPERIIEEIGPRTVELLGAEGFDTSRLADVLTDPAALKEFERLSNENIARINELQAQQGDLGGDFSKEDNKELYRRIDLMDDYADVINQAELNQEGLVAAEKAAYDAIIFNSKRLMQNRDAIIAARGPGAGFIRPTLNEDQREEIATLRAAGAEAKYLADVIDYMAGGSSDLAATLRYLPADIQGSEESMKKVLQIMQDTVTNAQALAGGLTSALFPDPTSYWKDFYKEGKNGAVGKFDLKKFTAKINLVTSDGVKLSDALQGVKDTLGAETYSLVLDIAQEDPNGALALIESLKNGDAGALEVALEFQSLVKEEEMKQWTAIGMEIGTQVANAMIDALDGVIGNYVPVVAERALVNSYLPFASVPQGNVEPIDVPAQVDAATIAESINAITPPEILLAADTNTLQRSINADTYEARVRLIADKSDLPSQSRFRTPEALGGIRQNFVRLFADGGFNGFAVAGQAGRANIANRATSIYAEAGNPEAFIPMRARPTNRDIAILDKVVGHFESKGIPVGGGNTINFNQTVNSNIHGADTAARRNVERFMKAFRNLG